LILTCPPLSELDTAVAESPNRRRAVEAPGGSIELPNYQAWSVVVVVFLNEVFTPLQVG
jgi:hypothetical protein